MTAVQTGIQPISAGRRLKDRAVQIMVYLAFVVAVVPLVSVLWLVVKNGLQRFDLEFLTHSMRNIGARDARYVHGTLVGGCTNRARHQFDVLTPIAVGDTVTVERAA